MNPDPEQFENAAWEMSCAELSSLNIDPDIPIHRDNAPLLALPEDHPARQTLIAQAVCRSKCACREIDWADSGIVGIDQEWKSATDDRLWKFSDFIYGHISFSLILEGWLTHPSQLTEEELQGLKVIPTALTLLKECEFAATKAVNQAILELIPIARNFFMLWQETINHRIILDDLTEN